MSSLPKDVGSLTPEQRNRIERQMLLRATTRGSSSIPRRPAGEPTPLSFAQQRLWFLAQLEPDAAAYNLVTAFRLEGAVDVEALQQSLAEVVARHETLRTCFVEEAGAPWQRILPFEGFPLHRSSLDIPAPDRPEAIRRLAAETVATPFDLGTAPLLRASLASFGESDHALVLCVHHIAADGWSLGILTRELSALYAAFRRGVPSPLPELPIQYGDFAVWQRGTLRGPALETALASWREHLQPPRGALDLPADRPRPAVQSFRGGRHDFALGARLARDLESLARREGVTPFVVLLAAFRVLLKRYTGQEDVIVGCPEANRSRSEIEGLVGFFANTLALRGDLSGDPTFVELLARERASSLAARSHQDLPFEKVVEDLRPERELSRNPLFQVLFAYQNAPRQPFRLDDLEVTAVSVDPGTVRFDLELHLSENGDGLGGAFRFSTDLFDRERIERMAGHFTVLLAAIAAEPERRLSRLPLMAGAERQLVLGTWNETSRGYATGLALHRLFEARVAEAPQAIAVEHAEESLTYAQLDARANRLARHLLTLGVGPEVRVGVCLSRSPELLVALLGVLKAGGAYVPLDPGYPEERVAFMLEDAGARVVVTEARHRGGLSGRGATLVCLDLDAAAMALQSSDAPASARVDAESLAYVIYTSGSTGRPKGVAITHRSAVVLIQWAREVFTDDDLDGVLASTSICFDVSVFEIFVPLVHGGRVVLVDNALALASLSPSSQVRLVSAVPSAIAELHRLGGIPGSVRTICLAGEQLATPLVSRLYEMGVDRVFDLYGPSEDTTYSTFALRRREGPETIGRGLAETQLFVLDRGGEPVPIGVPGELFIGGRGLARGYLNRPDLTAERFEPNPFSSEPGARLYRTGDLARYRSDGQLEFLGRIDHQVKIRGYRIELDEIEAVLREHTSVGDAVVIARDDAPTGKAIVAYVAAKPGSEAEAGSLQEHLRHKLPLYMIPSAFVQLERLPRTPNGKLDRSALPAPRGADRSSPGGRAPNQTEEILAGIFADVLGLEHVGVDDGFFDLGGHSLLATRVVARAREALRTPIPLRWVFERPTVAALAEKIASGALEGVPAAPPPPEPREGGGAAPLSFGQHRLWLLQEMDLRSSLYNLAAAVRLRGDLDVAALEASLVGLQERHASLRTRVERAGGVMAQRAEPLAAGWQLRIVDLESVPEADQEAEVKRLATGEARRPFDLRRTPLLRASLLRLNGSEHVLVLVVHHVAADGWSMGILVRELGALYAAHLAGRPAGLPDLPLEYADFAAWQRAWLRGDVLQSQLTYWKTQLAGLPPVLDLATDHPRPLTPRHRGARRDVTLPAPLAAALRRVAREQGATLYMVLLAAFQALLARQGGRTDIVVGSPIAGRTRPELESLVGFFVNTLVLRTDLSGDPTFVEVLRRVREVALGAYAHQDLPFERLVEELNPERTLAHHPLFQIAFALQNTPREALSLKGLSLEREELGDDFAKFDLQLTLAEEPGGTLAASLRYDRDLFAADTADRLLIQYRRLLESVVTRTSARLSEVPLLGDDERRRILAEWNDTARTYPQLGLGRLFQDQAGRSPEAVAATFRTESLTYLELDRRSNQVARFLARLGVARGTRVGLLAERSLDLLVGLLGIVKAGAAYVPLDPDYPQDRLAFMVEDAEVPVLLTQERLVGLVPERQPKTSSRPATRVVCLDRDWDSISREGSEAFDGGAGPDDLAYVIYTSGSTGAPKGVEVRHRGVARLVFASGFASFGPEQVFLQLAPVTFDASTLEVWGPLLHGGRCVLHPGRLPSPEEIGETLKREGVTTLWLTSSLYNTVIDRAPMALSGLKQLLIGGEALSVPHVTAGLEHLSGTRIINGYGPTESTTFTCCFEIHRDQPLDRSVSIGRPIGNTRVYLLDGRMEPVPVGVTGELYIGGDGLARGYLKRPDLTAERFVPDPFAPQGGERLYRTGDLARYRADGRIEFLGRGDQQVKVRGYRIELGEIESALKGHPAVSQSAVTVREDSPGDRRLVAYVTLKEGATVTVSALREALRVVLPEYMVPGLVAVLPELPRTANGKVDKAALPAPDTTAGPAASAAAPTSDVERAVARVWQELLRVPAVSLHDNFFDLGGHSLLLVEAQGRLLELYPESALRVVDLFRYPTVKSLSEHLGSGAAPLLEPRLLARTSWSASPTREEVAVVGLAGRFPKARDTAEFWRNLREGIECVTFFSDEELRAAGVADHLLQDPRYVRARGVLERVDEFDAAFFGYTPREAEIMDPQQRVFLECAWEGLEDAGYDAERFAGLVGVFAGTSQSTYLLNHLYRNRELLAAVGALQTKIGNDKDMLATRVAYELGLRGPGVSVQTACSTSLVAVHLACQALRNRECDVALAGGVSILVPQQTGYLYQEEGIGSPDGRCRAFDAKARGTVSGSGVGVVVLKRLADAVRDGDNVRAVIKGSAINNDGSLKVGFTAPSVSGQAEVIAAAQAAAGVSPESIGYVEAHGTGTALGDPIEVEALTQAFREGTDKTAFCGLGSLKTNVGHLDAAAGVAGLIKTVLALEHQEIPPSLHCDSPNPKIAFGASPFFVSTSLSPWRSAGPRRAGVSSFGIGGTNAHVVLEEAPARPEAGDDAPPSSELLLLAAKTEPALEQSAARLRAHLASHPEQDLADVAYTLQAGRRRFACRRAFVVERPHPGGAAVLAEDPRHAFAGRAEAGARQVAFLFPGQGTQAVGMFRSLYLEERVFRAELDRCAEMLLPELGLDLRELVHPDGAGGDAANRRLDETWLAQPALFAIEFALAQLWMSWGVRPTVMLGHSLGEYVAAHLAGVLSLEDALALVAERGRLMQSAPRGSMLAVASPAGEVEPLLGAHLSLAALNAPRQCVVSGPHEAVGALKSLLDGQGVEARLLATSHAFHSSMMDAVVDEFEASVRRMTLRAPRVPMYSNVTGRLLTAQEATDPRYWARHLRATVRFSDAVASLLGEPALDLVEVGPGRTLGTLVRQSASWTAGRVGVWASSEARDSGDRAQLLQTAGRLWVAGHDLDASGLHSGQARRRLPLPTYPFERKRFWAEAPPAEAAHPREAPLAKRASLDSWFYVPVWKSAPPSQPRRRETLVDPRPCLVFGDAAGVGAQLAARLREEGRSVVRVLAGTGYARLSEGEFTIRPGRAEDYESLLGDLSGEGRAPWPLVHAWSAAPLEEGRSGRTGVEAEESQGFWSLCFLLRALARRGEASGASLCVVTSHVHDVTGAEVLAPERWPVLGFCKVAPQEYPDLSCRAVDVAPGSTGLLDDRSLGALVEQCLAGEGGGVSALRQGRRFVQVYEPFPLPAPTAERNDHRRDGCFLITGGLGRIGLEMAAHLARDTGARLALVGRTGLPLREEWDAWLTTHEGDATSRGILGVRALESRGAEVLVLAADVADPASLARVMATIEDRFGPLHGVIHAAGATRGASFAPLVDLEPALGAEAFRAKALGLAVLDEAVRHLKLDFRVVMSSLATVLGGMHMGAYAAANLFADGFAARESGRDDSWTSVNWDGWRFEEGTPRDAAAGSVASLAMTPFEGLRAFDRILAGPAAPRVVVSTGDLERRLDVWVRRTPAPADPGPGHSPAAPHARPELSRPHRATGTPVERAIAEIWQGLLGIGGIGADDDFFELGGHSLLATQLATRLRETFGAEVSLRELFSNPTVATLAERVVEAEAAPGQADRVARVLQRLREMTPEERQALALERDRQAQEPSP